MSPSIACKALEVVFNHGTVLDLGWSMEPLHEQLPKILERIVKQRVEALPRSDSRGREQLKSHLEHGFQHEAHFIDERHRVKLLKQLKSLKLQTLLPRCPFSVRVKLDSLRTIKLPTF